MNSMKYKHIKIFVFVLAMVAELECVRSSTQSHKRTKWRSDTNAVDCAYDDLKKAKLLSRFSIFDQIHQQPTPGF